MISVHFYMLLSLYGLLFLSLVLCLALFLSVKREIRRSEGRMKRQQIHLQEAYDRVEGGLEALKGMLKDGNDRASTLVHPAPPGSGLNSDKRARATRMFREGDRPEQIAVALSVPQSEINLLLKTHEAALTASSTA